MLSALLYFLIAVFVICIVIGLLVMLVRRAPFIDEPWRSWAEWLLYAIGVVAILAAALPLLRGLINTTAGL